jgi:hypothetical protein
MLIKSWVNQYLIAAKSMNDGEMAGRTVAVIDVSLI